METKMLIKLHIQAMGVQQNVTFISNTVISK